MATVPIDNNCSVCGRVVTGRQHALTCDTCVKWCHRLCGTGMTQTEYREVQRILKAGGQYHWVCPVHGRDMVIESFVEDMVVESFAEDIPVPMAESTTIAEPEPVPGKLLCLL